MPKQISLSQIDKILKSVMHPRLEGHNIVDLKMIDKVTLDAGRVTIDLALPSLETSLKQQLIDEIRESIRRVRDDFDIEINPVKMSASQKAAIQSIAREKYQVKPQQGVHVRNVLAVMSGKGGVGKSSVAGLLASSLRKRGFEIGLLDADITGPSIPKIFGAHQPPTQEANGIKPVESKQGIKLMSINLLLPDENQAVVWRGPLISRAIQQFWSDIAWGNLDALIVDLPPGTSDASLTVMQSLPLDGIVLVTSPQDLAGMVVHKAANMAEKLSVRLIGLVENMSYFLCPECDVKIDLFGPSHAETTADAMGTELLGRIPLDPSFSSLCDQGNIESFHSREFERIVDRILEVVPLKNRSHEKDTIIS